MKYSNFNKPNLMTLRAELLKVLKEHGPEGIEFTLGNIKFSDSECTIALSAKIEGAKTMTDVMLETRCAALGLQIVNKSGWKLVGYKPKNWKMPFLFERDGKTFKCSEDQAKFYFKA
jgi:hypothetical protein